MPIFQDESSLSSVVPEEVGMSSDKASLLVKELNIRINQGHLPGAVLMAVRNHKIAVHEAIGYRDKNCKFADAERHDLSHCFNDKAHCECRCVDAGGARKTVT